MPGSTLMTKILPHHNLPRCWPWGDLWQHVKQIARSLDSFQRSRAQSWWRNKSCWNGSGRCLLSFFHSRVALGFPLHGGTGLVESTGWEISAQRVALCCGHPSRVPPWWWQPEAVISHAMCGPWQVYWWVKSPQQGFGRSLLFFATSLWCCKTTGCGCPLLWVHLSLPPWGSHDLEDQQLTDGIGKERTDLDKTVEERGWRLHGTVVLLGALRWYTVFGLKGFLNGSKHEFLYQHALRDFAKLSLMPEKPGKVWPCAKKNHSFSSQRSNDFSTGIQEPNKITEHLLIREQRRIGRWGVPASCHSIPRHSLHPIQKSTHRLAQLSGALTVQHLDGAHAGG